MSRRPKWCPDRKGEAALVDCCVEAETVGDFEGVLMINSSHVAHRRNARALFVLAGSVLAALMLPMSGSARAEDRINPCEGYKVYVAMGSEDSGSATALKRVCDTIGPVTITQPCLVYYTRATDTVFPPDQELKAKLADECETSMPGGAGLAIAAGDPGDPGAPGGPCRDRPCIGEDLVLVPEPDLSNGVPPTDILECGAGLECRPEPDEPTPVDDAASPSVQIEPPTDTMECGSGAECLPPSDDLLSPVDPDEVDRVTAADRPQSNGTGAPAQATPPVDPALDLAFWQAIVDSNDPALFQAYLDRFPDGTFAPIAKARIAAPSGAAPQVAAPVEPPPEPEPVEAPVAQIVLPQKLFDQAQAIMDAAYQLDVSKWNAEARRAIPLYEKAGEGGWAPAYVELGALAENGIGMPSSLDVSRDYFLKAGRLGDIEGYYRALMVLDQAGNRADYVEIFLTLYRIDPDMALQSLDAVGRVGPLALQSYLRQQGYYTGALDGDFGPGSRVALDAYVKGAPPVTDTPLPASGDVLAANLQKELQRVGCYIGEIDGRWGPGSTGAMQAFDLWNGSNLAADHPTEQALRLVSAARGMVCGMD